MAWAVRAIISVVIPSRRSFLAASRPDVCDEHSSSELPRPHEADVYFCIPVEIVVCLVDYSGEMMKKEMT